MLTVRYRSWVDRPPHRVTCRLDAPLGSDGTRPELTGLYRDGMWVFELPGEGWTTCRLVLDGQVEGVFPTGVRDTAAAVSADHERAARGFTDDDVIFATPPIAVDDGRLQQTWFAEGPEKDQLWDVVVVGTGMGGGVLLSALADKVVEGAQPTMAVLGLEAGSLLFPTHVANLPRVYFGGPTAFSTSLWSTIETFGSQPFATDPGPVDPPVAEADRWTGHEVFALGGRTLYWGGLCPRISEGELDRWPPPVTRDLVDSTAPGQPGGYYDRAEVLLGVGSPDADPLQSRTEQMLDGLGTGRINEPAPVALRHEKRTSWRIPGGLFSTAELLLEGRLSQAAPNGSFGVPYLHLGELVVGVEPIADADGGRWLVRGVDLRDNSPTRHRARAVVLSAGTVESARIIEASPVQLPGAGVGVGLTEHTMVFKHFQIPPSTVPDGSTGSAQVLSTPPSRDSPDQWNLLLELGSDLALGRSYPLPWSDTKVTDGWIAGSSSSSAGRTSTAARSTSPRTPGRRSTHPRAPACTRRSCTPRSAASRKSGRSWPTGSWTSSAPDRCRGRRSPPTAVTGGPSSRAAGVSSRTRSGPSAWASPEESSTAISRCGCRARERAGRTRRRRGCTSATTRCSRRARRPILLSPSPHSRCAWPTTCGTRLTAPDGLGARVAPRGTAAASW